MGCGFGANRSHLSKNLKLSGKEEEENTQHVFLITQWKKNHKQNKLYTVPEVASSLEFSKASVELFRNQGSSERLIIQDVKRLESSGLNIKLIS